MKKIILLAVVVLMVVGCDQQVANSVTEDDFGVCVYDSCEYLIARHGYRGYLAHKGNCRFCAERKRQETEALVIKLKEK